MALSQADLEYYRKVLNKLSMTAWDDFQKSFADLPQWEAVSAKRALSGAWPELIDYYGNIAAAFGADNVETWADEMGIKPVVKMVEGVDPARATARAEWALSTADPTGNFKVLLDELVKQPYRSTVHNSAKASGVGWARVPTGSETCSFCLMLASRGGVYRSKQIAKLGTNGKKYHGACDCTPVLVRDESDYPEGYDPGALFDVYDSAVSAAGDKTRSNTKAILSQMRVITENPH